MVDRKRCKPCAKCGKYVDKKDTRICGSGRLCIPCYELYRKLVHMVGTRLRSNHV